MEMGWFFDNEDVERKEFIRRLTDKSRFSTGFQHLEHRVVGNYVWHLMLDVEKGRKFIALDMIRKERNAGWGYKSMTEEAGPFVYNCPLTLLEKADEPEGFAVKWREKVRIYHKRQKLKRDVKPGMVIEYSGNLYRLMAYDKFRKAWEVERLSDRSEFLMLARQVNHFILENGVKNYVG
jgi:hypothetical protein